MNWWADCVPSRRLRSEPVGPQQYGALMSMTSCVTSGNCKFPPERMMAMFEAALSHGDDPEILNIFGSYAINALRDPQLTSRLWHEAARLRPAEPQYRANLVRLYIATHDFDLARREIQGLRDMGRAGQNEALADSLGLDLEKARSAGGTSR
jgi:protein O-mannosyl-transferase